VQNNSAICILQFLRRIIGNVFYASLKPKIIHSTVTQNPDSGLVSLDWRPASSVRNVFYASPNESPVCSSDSFGWGLCAPRFGQPGVPSRPGASGNVAPYPAAPLG
jgi:hypothetical protein